MANMFQLLRHHGIQATPQRIAVAEYILGAKTHPSADEVWAHVRRRCPTLSRATVYNTLNLFAEKGLVKARVLKEGTVLFDPRMENHHHFIDLGTGVIHDVPWEALKVTGAKNLPDFDVVEYHVVLRGRRRGK